MAYIYTSKPVLFPPNTRSITLLPMIHMCNMMMGYPTRRGVGSEVHTKQSTQIWSNQIFWVGSRVIFRFWRVRRGGGRFEGFVVMDGGGHRKKRRFRSSKEMNFVASEVKKDLLFFILSLFWFSFLGKFIILAVHLCKFLLIYNV